LKAILTILLTSIMLAAGMTVAGCQKPATPVPKLKVQPETPLPAAPPENYMKAVSPAGYFPLTKRKHMGI